MRRAPSQMAMNRTFSTASGRARRLTIGVLGFLLCVTGAAFGQATQPGREEPKREQPPPEDSPDPLPNARREYEALFGGATTLQQGRSFLNFTGGVLQVYDRDEVEEGEPELDGFYTNLTGDLDYRRHGDRTTVAANLGTNQRYYTQLSRFLAADYHGGIGIESRIARRTILTLNQVASYSPVTLPNLFLNPLPPELGDSLPPGNNFAVTNNRFLTAATTGSVEHGFSVRSQLVARASYRINNFLDQDEELPSPDWSMFDSGAFYRYRVTRSRSLRAGYNYRQASYGWTEPLTGFGAQPDEHNFFVGVTIDREFSAETRTMVSFSGGTSVFGAIQSSDVLLTGDRVRLTFDGSVAQQIGKTWLLLGAFSRGSQFDQGYGGPVFGDAVSVSATGFFNARTDLTAWLGYTQGQTLLAVAGQTFETATGGARFRYALSRRWALTAEYFRFSYDFTNAPDNPLVPGVPPRFGRNSFRGGVVMFFPLASR